MKAQLSWFGGVFVICNIVSTSTLIAPENAVSTGINEFTVEFYKKVSNEKNNLICSPISADIVLAMASYGAGGNTKKQMQSVLRIPDDITMARSGFQSIIDNFNTVKKVKLSLANKIFTNSKFQMKREFVEITKTSFRSPAESLDFDEAEEASHTINTWCEEKTNNRIHDIIGPNDLRSAMMVLVNAVYFKGNWASKFQPKLTALRQFYLNDSSTKDVPMMFKYDKLNCGKLQYLELDATFVELPYKSENDNDAISMFIILPDNISGLKEVESKLDKINFKLLHDRPNPNKAYLYMPKFRIESTLNLMTVLQSMGMNEMFGDSANFTGITDDTVSLRVSKIIQKAFIEVNEEGSEAAAVTVGGTHGIRPGMPKPPPITIMINRPFIYTIVHTATNIVLFQGHIVQPKSQ